MNHIMNMEVTELKLHFIALILLSGCFQNSNSGGKVELNQESQAIQTCSLPKGSFPLQNVVFDKTKKSYELMVLGVPSCVVQPIIHRMLYWDV